MNSAMAGPGAQARSWELALPRGRKAVVGPRPVVCGILNCTPDSFSDGGAYAESADAVAAGLRMLAEGADWLDLGGESTRPGAAPVEAAEQLRRVLPALAGLRERTQAPISIDTRDPEVARACLERGADIINDVGGFRASEWLPLLREWDVPILCVHMQGSPADMQRNPTYPSGVTAEVLSFFLERRKTLEESGIDPSRLLFDPGLGFGKRVKDNLELIRNIDAFHRVGRPIYIGTSRKSFLSLVLDQPQADRDLATVIVNCMALIHGANVLRVHDVAKTVMLSRLHSAVFELPPAPGASTPVPIERGV